ncbi:protein of unknown function [Nitrospira defluvii]|jgi:hypothetical protein|uniref:Uncharacterized protein n=1 Tax=Nitrospira defluvii TaxID=330214 RepID=D8PFV7_9BACT|nr:protein of unknown function [Nitrospira defluvii]
MILSGSLSMVPDYRDLADPSVYRHSDMRMQVLESVIPVREWVEAGIKPNAARYRLILQIS